MLNSRRGASVIVSAILLIGVATAAALVLWSAFGVPSLPQSNVKAELEDIRIVKVTLEDGVVKLYVINRGSTYATIDSIYLESIYGGLNQSVAVNPITLAPGELKSVTLPASFNNVINIKAVTSEGKQSNVLVLEPSSVQNPSTNPIFSSGSLNLLPYAISNYDQWIYVTNKSVQEVDAKFVSTFSSETIKDYDTQANTNEADAWNSKLLNSNKNQDTWQYDGPRIKNALLYWSITYGGKVQSASIPTIKQLVVELVLKIEPKPNTLAISFYDWNTKSYVTGGPGYKMVTVENTTEQNIVMYLPVEKNSGYSFINTNSSDPQQYGAYKFAINMTHLDDGKPDNSKIVVQARTVAVIAEVPTQEINPIFYFDLSSVDVSRIASLVFTFSGTFSAPSIPLTFNLYNFTASTWVKQSDFTSNSNSGDPTNIQLVVDKNFNYYISSTKELRANLKSMVINGSVYQLDIDQFRLEVVYK